MRFKNGTSVGDVFYMRGGPLREEKKLLIIFKAILKKRSKINFTKIDQADLDSTRQELSNDGLGIVVALTVR